MALGGISPVPGFTSLLNGRHDLLKLRAFAVPFSKGAILQLAAATLVPVVPLLLTMMPLDELLKILLGILF